MPAFMGPTYFKSRPHLACLHCPAQPISPQKGCLSLCTILYLKGRVPKPGLFLGPLFKAMLESLGFLWGGPLKT